jgi:bifunctional DNA-binding transcriptional regulator/antitoxin component of YhaV-PrlF toxin-antitoxin module
MPRATVTSKGQITNPRSIRHDVGQLKGLLRRAGRKPVSIEQMNTAIARQGR